MLVGCSRLAPTLTLPLTGALALKLALPSNRFIYCHRPGLTQRLQSARPLTLKLSPPRAQCLEAAIGPPAGFGTVRDQRADVKAVAGQLANSKTATNSALTRRLPPASLPTQMPSPTRALTRTLSPGQPRPAAARPSPSLPPQTHALARRRPQACLLTVVMSQTRVLAQRPLQARLQTLTLSLTEAAFGPPATSGTIAAHRADLGAAGPPANPTQTVTNNARLGSRLAGPDAVADSDLRADSGAATVQAPASSHPLASLILPPTTRALTQRLLPARVALTDFAATAR